MRSPRTANWPQREDRAEWSIRRHARVDVAVEVDDVGLGTSRRRCWLPVQYSARGHAV